MAPKKVTMQTIADNLNLSKSLVSRALADRYGVNEKTRALILNEAKRLHYNLPTAHKATGTTPRTIAVYMRRSTFLDTGFGAEIISGIEMAINKRHFHMSLTLVDDRAGSLSVTFDPYVVGIIMTITMEQLILQQVQQLGIPCVVIDPRYFHANIDCVTADNYGGMYTATSHLIELGHRRLLFAGDPNQAYSFRQRFHGYQDCVQAHRKLGVEGHQLLVTDYPHTFSKSEFLREMESDFTPTGILCANDVTAIQVYQLLGQLGLRIPEDVSVIGFDDIAEAAHLSPPLTTLHLSKQSLGEYAIRRLLDRDHETDEYLVEQISVQLIKRGSVAPPPTADTM